MGVEQMTTITVTCDNPSCPGNSLDPSTVEGWIEVVSNLHGGVSAGGIFCSPACAGTIEQELLVKIEVEEARKLEIENQLPVPEPVE